MTGTPTLSAFRWVPPFAQGQVRDLRVRWALEEMGRDYSVDLLDAMNPRPDGYKQRQPFGQVPAFDDGAVRLFETGAILLYLGEQDERLLAAEGEERWDAIAWLFSALNSVEPFLMTIVLYDVFNAGKDWAKAARPSAVELAEKRLADLAAALGDREWLAGQFSIADIAMVTVLRIIDDTGILDAWPNLTAYRKRGTARPAFERALKAQLATFAQNEPAAAE